MEQSPDATDSNGNNNENVNKIIARVINIEPLVYGSENTYSLRSPVVAWHTPIHTRKLTAIRKRAQDGERNELARKWKHKLLESVCRVEST